MTTYASRADSARLHPLSSARLSTTPTRVLRKVSDSPPPAMHRPPFVAQLLKAVIAGAIVSPIAMAPINRFAPLVIGASVAGAVFLAVWQLKKPLATCAAAVLIGAIANYVARDIHLQRHYAVGFVLLPAFGIGFFAAYCVCCLRGRWWRAGVACGVWSTAAAIVFLNRVPVLAKYEQLSVRLQKWTDQRVEASAQRALHEMVTIDRVEIRAKDGSSASPSSLRRTVTGHEAEEVAARWRKLHFQLIGHRDTLDSLSPLLYELRFFRGDQLVQCVGIDIRFKYFHIAGHPYRDCTFSPDRNEVNRNPKLGELIPVNAVRAYEASWEAFWRPPDDKAMALYREAVALDPQNAEYRCNIGRIYRETGKFAKAVEEYSRAVNLAPKNMEIRFERAGCYAALGRPDDAIADYNIMIADPQSSGALVFYYRGVQYLDLGKTNDAIADFDKALSSKGALNEDEAKDAIRLRERARKLAGATAPSKAQLTAPPATTSSPGATGR